MVFLNIFLFAAAVSANCYEATTAHPLPKLDPNDVLLKHAFSSIQTALDTAVSAAEYNATSFSVEITSSKESLWSHHHTARERNASRPDIPEVTGDALYRIASITKVFTVLGVLYQHEAGNMHLDDPINKYIKELKDDQNGTLPWKDITLRSLASQLSGIPREFAQGDMINDQSGERRPAQVGLPPISREGLLTCDEYSPRYEKPCTAYDLLQTVKSQRPLFAPNMKPSYSNVAFELLGLALARTAGQTYEQYIAEEIFKPLNMSKSTITTPPDSAGVIPKNPQYWDVDEGIQNPTGGIYSSTTDLSQFLRYVLTHYNAITTGVNWFNVGSASGGVRSFYGMPWEIFHTDRILKDSKRTVRFITKGGGLPGYTSVIIAVPEYDLGITILVAGEAKLFSQIRDVVTTGIVRAAESVAIRQLKERYVGAFKLKEKLHRESSITLQADERGLVVTNFYSNGTDVLRNSFKLSQSAGGYVQLMPTLLYIDEKNQKGELWRAIAINGRGDSQDSPWDDFCVNDFDHPLYAGLPVNEVVFWDEKDGQYGRLELTGYRKNLTRVAHNGLVAEPQTVMEL